MSSVASDRLTSCLVKLPLAHCQVLFTTQAVLPATCAPLPSPAKRTMGLADNVSALLETYDNCVCLLKAFKRQKKQDGGRRTSRASDQQALLKHSLKTDRRKVERAWSSRRSESGGRFEQGDCKNTLSEICLVLEKSPQTEPVSSKSDIGSD